MYRPSGEKPRKLSSSSGLTPRPGTAGKVASTRLADGPASRQGLPSREVTERPSGLIAYWPEPMTPAPVGERVRGGAPASSAPMTLLFAVSYAASDWLAG